MRILIVDDETAIREWIKFSIEKMKLPDVEEIYTAANSRDALTIYKEYYPDLIFVDMMLPNIHGLELIKILKSYSEHIQIFIISSHAVFDYVRTGLSYGAAEYILKEELTYEKLTNVIKDALERRNHLSEQPVLWKYNDTPFLQALRPRQDVIIDEALLKGYNITLQNQPILILAGDTSLLSALDVLRLPARIQLNHGAYFIVKDSCHVLLANLVGMNRDVGIREVLEHLKSSFSFLLGKGNVEMGVAGGWDGLASVFQRTLCRLQMHFYEDEGVWEGYPQENVDEIIDVCRKKIYLKRNARTLSGYRAEIDRLIMEIYEKKPLPIDKVKYGVAEILTIVIQNIAQTLGNEVILSARDNIMEAESFERLRQHVSEICDKIDALAEVRTQMSSTVRLAVAYIQENLLQTVSLEDVALHVNQSPDYLSRLMKKELGEGFLDYITRLKMEKAIELLRTTPMKIYEVAEALGYANVSYFSELFRKRIGVNPCKYKRYY